MRLGLNRMGMGGKVVADSEEGEPFSLPSECNRPGADLDEHIAFCIEAPHRDQLGLDGSGANAVAPSSSREVLSGNSLPATVSLGAVEKIQMVALQEIQLFLQAGSLRIEIDLEIREVMAINSVTRPKSSRANSRSQAN